MAAAIIPEAAGIAGGLAGLIGGPDKNKIRDQQEAANYASAQSGSVSAAQTIYNNQKPGSGQTHERIVDDQKYWGLLQQAGWTVDGSGTVHPPSLAAKVGNALTLGGGGATGNLTISGTAAPPNPFLTAGTAVGSIVSSPTGELLLFGGALVLAVLLVVAVRK